MASEYVGIDLHRRRSVIVRQNTDGEVLEQVRIDNDPVALACAIEKASPDGEVALEVTYGWYWAIDVLEACGANVHLAHPLRVKGWAYRRVKTDQVDASGLADLLRMNRLPEAWIAPPALRSGLKAQVHAVLAKEGVGVGMSDPFGTSGRKLLADAPLSTAYRMPWSPCWSSSTPRTTRSRSSPTPSPPGCATTRVSHHPDGSRGGADVRRDLCHRDRRWVCQGGFQ